MDYQLDPCNHLQRHTYCGVVTKSTVVINLNITKFKIYYLTIFSLRPSTVNQTKTDSTFMQIKYLIFFEFFLIKYFHNEKIIVTLHIIGGTQTIFSQTQFNDTQN